MENDGTMNLVNGIWGNIKKEIIMPKHKMKKKKKVPKGYHMMPGGKLMKGAKHKSKKGKY